MSNKSAGQILSEHATKNNDGFLDAKQRKWIIEAMEEYGKQEAEYVDRFAWQIAREEIDKHRFINEGDRPFGVHP